MAVYQIPTDGEGIHRAMYQTLTIDGNTFSVRIELQYFQRTDKWYLSIYDIDIHPPPFFCGRQDERSSWPV